MSDNPRALRKVVEELIYISVYAEEIGGEPWELHRWDIKRVLGMAERALGDTLEEVRAEGRALYHDNG
jgi:hypothetical protein